GPGQELVLGQGTSVDLARPLQRRLNMQTDVLCSHVLFEFCLMHQLGGLLACSTEQQSASRGSEMLRQFLQCMEPSAVDCGHVAQAQDHDRRQCRDILSYFSDLLSSSKEKWTMDTKDLYVFRNLFVLQDVDTRVLDVFFAYL